MKKVIFAIFLLIAGMSVASAQVRSGMKYSELKHQYSVRGYHRSATDTYSPGWSAFASYVIPGLGQVMSRETGRGIRFFAASTAISAVGYYQADKLLDNIVKDADGNAVKDASGDIQFIDEKAAKRQITYLCAAGLSELFVCFWSCADAAKVAKVKNLYSRDLRNHAIEPSMYPSVQTVMSSNGCQLAPGITLAMKF